MFTIFYREIRNIGKWAFIAALVVCSIAAVSIYKMRGTYGYDVLFVNVGVLGFMDVGFAAAAFMLGMVSVAGDYPSGRWTLLTHRPISRWRIFLAKFLAAAALYVLAAAVPMLGVMVWVAISGDVAGPVDWHLLLAIGVELIGGVCCVSAGMLTVARRGALAGSKLLPILAAIVVCAFAEAAPMPMPGAFAILLMATTVMAVVAGSAFVHAGEYEPQPALSRWLQAGVLAVGLLAAVAVAVVVVTTWLGTSVAAQTLPPVRYELNFAGQLYVEWGGKVVRDIGEPMPTPTPVKGVHWHDEAPLVKLDRNWSGGPAERLPVMGYYRQLVYPLSGYTDQQWFYVASRRTIELYDAAHFAGTLGPAGFRPRFLPPVPFPEDLHFVSGASASSDRSIWSIETNVRKAQRIFTAPPGERILGFGAAEMPVERWMEIIVTDKAVHLGPLGSVSGAIPLTGPARGFDSLQVAKPTKDRFILLCMPQNVLIEADGAGHILRQTQLPPLRQPRPSEWIVTRIFTAITAPPILAWTGGWFPVDPRQSWLMILSALAAAAIGWLALRRYPASHVGRAAWLILCLALGWSGVLLLLCTRTAIVRVKCPACGGKRLTTQARCRRCGAPFPPPGQTGVEIIESRQAVEAGI